MIADLPDLLAPASLVASEQSEREEREIEQVGSQRRASRGRGGRRVHGHGPFGGVQHLDVAEPQVRVGGGDDEVLFDEPVEAEMVRTLAWISAMNGALLLDRLGAEVGQLGVALGQDHAERALHAALEDLASAAAFRVKVMARMWSGSTPFSISLT